MNVADIRLAGSDDVERLALLERELFGVEAWSEHSVCGGVEREHTVCVVADAAGAVVGYAFVSVAGDMADLLRIAVEPRWQRQRVATQLLLEAIKCATQRSAESMLVEVSEYNTAGLGFYGRQDFAEVDRRAQYFRDRSDAIVMRRALTPGGGSDGS